MDRSWRVYRLEYGSNLPTLARACYTELSCWLCALSARMGSPRSPNMPAKPSDELQQVDGTAVVVSSDGMRKLMSMVERVARHDAAVLISGETGSGKELIGRLIHHHSLRCSKPFVDVNCAAFPEHLVESELFGYEKGAFSGADATKQGLFELADQGTLFLDEIGELDAKVQAKLLRVLDGVQYYRLGGHHKVTVNVRVVAATNRNLKDEVQEGRFRRDLYHRLAQFELHVPPLRERPEDIIPIADLFLQQYSPGASLSSDAAQALQEYQWPGNVRELKNVILRATISVEPEAREIRASHLPGVVFGAPVVSPTRAGNSLEEVEKQMILQATTANSGSQARAAQQLGISVRTLRRKLEKYKYGGADAKALGRLSRYQQRYFRVLIEVPVTLTCGNQQIQATTVDVSSGGLAIRSPLPLGDDALFDLSFVLPGAPEPMMVKARLAWMGPEGVAGLTFVDVHPAFQRELDTWLAEKARAEGWAEIRS
jgi:DNA-binding NtrC family response regulator